MAQIVGIVAAQIAADEAQKMLQKQNQDAQNQKQNQQSPNEQSSNMSAPSGGMFSPDSAMQLASSMLPKNFDSLLQKKGSEGGQNQIGSVIDKGEDLLNEGIGMGKSFLGK
ncbi:TPA: hypothetical protein ACTXXA_003690 [Legionella anisa]